MKKTINFFLCLAGLVFLCLLCAFAFILIKNWNSEPKLEEELIALEDGKLKVGYMDSNYELPEELKKELGVEISEEFVSPLKKIDESLGSQIAERLGREYVAVKVDSDILKKLSKGKFDCVISAVKVTPEISQNYNVSEPYFTDQNGQYAVILNKDNQTLLDEVNEIICQLDEEGILDTLFLESNE
ncbi:transporter substrate-binding domain-containing protein [Treponema sp.]|uniref:transporter substrate-binding domain-containing protein n=1 Tax=Treponema sp. TaxID=166 RepID=UPI0025FA0463|nr:transporter substrate-binding domain-containing protein [Treponema sp.]MCR5218195.1 transporter substrate-binding domain-containing protein [Treponema sp.]